MYNMYHLIITHVCTCVHHYKQKQINISTGFNSKDFNDCRFVLRLVLCILYSAVFIFIFHLTIWIEFWNRLVSDSRIGCTVGWYPAEIFRFDRRQSRTLESIIIFVYGEIKSKTQKNVKNNSRGSIIGFSW